MRKLNELAECFETNRRARQQTEKNPRNDQREQPFLNANVSECKTTVFDEEYPVFDALF